MLPNYGRAVGRSHGHRTGRNQHMQNMEHMQRMQHMEHMEHMEYMEHMQHMQHMEHMEHMERMQRMQRMQRMHMGMQHTWGAAHAPSSSRYSTTSPRHSLDPNSTLSRVTVISLVQFSVLASSRITLSMARVVFETSR
jgi:hypothetical protein